MSVKGKAQKITAEYNLESLYPDLMKEWDFGANTLKPSEVFPRGDARPNWVCSKGHKWTATVSNRTMAKSGCPYCSGRRCTPERSLATLFPEIAAEWHPSNPFGPELVSLGSKVKYKFICRRDPSHVFESNVNNRTAGKNGCGICTGAQVGTNTSLAHLRPDLAEEWHPENTTGPHEVTTHSAIKAKWKCKECERVWTAKVYSRSNGRGCRKCTARRHCSKAQKEIYDILSSSLRCDVVLNDWKALGSRELDIWIPSLNKAIEYDGDYWNSKPKAKKSDAEKNRVCEENGIDLLRIQEADWKSDRYSVLKRVETWLGQSLGGQYE